MTRPRRGLMIIAAITMTLGALTIAFQQDATAAIPNDTSRSTFKSDCAIAGGTFYENPDGSYGCDYGDWWMECTPTECIIVCTGDMPCVSSSEDWRNEAIENPVAFPREPQEMEAPERDPVTPSPVFVRGAARANDTVARVETEGVPTQSRNASPQPIAAEEGVGQIFVNTFGCPRGFDAYEVGILTLVIRCQVELGGVTFSLAELNEANTRGMIYQRETDGDVPVNAVAFRDVQAGRISIGEVVPQGYGTPIVFCDGYVPSDPDTSGLTQVDVVSGFRVDYRLSSDEWLFCEWFNVPAVEGDVTSNPAVSGSESQRIERAVDDPLCQEMEHGYRDSCAEPPQAEIAKLSTPEP